MNQVCSYSQYGDESVLDWQEIPDRLPQANQVIVKVSAVSVNPVDWKIMAGEQSLFTGRSCIRPRIFGSDFAGVIQAVGNPAKATKHGLHIGTSVMGMVNPLVAGSFQKKLCVDIKNCVPLPPGTDLIHAAGMPAAGTTAWRVVKPLIAARWAHQTILLNGAAGGVGTLILQMLAARGATVLATASASRHALLQELGAAQCLDYNDPTAVQASAPWDALLDCHGGFLHLGIRDFVKPGGRYVPVSIPNSDILGTLIKFLPNLCLHGIHSGVVLASPSQAILKQLAVMLHNHELQVPIDQIFNQSQLKPAVQRSIAGHVAGKIIIRFDE